MTRPTQITRIIWHDSMSLNGWRDLEAARISRVIECTSVGFVMAETDSDLVLCPTYGEELNTHQAPQVLGAIVIPKAVILQRSFVEML